MEGGEGGYRLVIDSMVSDDPATLTILPLCARIELYRARKLHFVVPLKRVSSLEMYT